MSIDQRIKDAIGESVADHNQSENLTTKIIAWLEALADGNETLENKDKVDQHLELIYAETRVNISEP
ncbi:MAG TPA: CxC ATPase DNA modification system associated small protein [Pyrinomonadaceae bacterium]|nr:CxC ATPase DNA modification system associated small protein [Pyrinomonadaceae bacterium]